VCVCESQHMCVRTHAHTHTHTDANFLSLSLSRFPSLPLSLSLSLSLSLTHTGVGDSGEQGLDLRQERVHSDRLCRLPCPHLPPGMGKCLCAFTTSVVFVCNRRVHASTCACIITAYMHTHVHACMYACMSHPCVHACAHAHLQYMHTLHIRVCDPCTHAFTHTHTHTYGSQSTAVQSIQPGPSGPQSSRPCATAATNLPISTSSTSGFVPPHCPSLLTLRGLPSNAHANDTPSTLTTRAAQYW
jgi:hypothetical protein